MHCKIFLRSSLSKDTEFNFQRSFKNEIDLPFVPVIGQELAPVTWITFVITSVIFDIQGQYFEVQAKQKCLNSTENDIEHIASALTAAGWVDFS